MCGQGYYYYLPTNHNPLLRRMHMDNELKELCEKVLNGEPVRVYTGQDLLLDYWQDMDTEMVHKLMKFLHVRLDFSDKFNTKLIPVCGYCGSDLDPNAWECPGCGSI